MNTNSDFGGNGTFQVGSSFTGSAETLAGNMGIDV